MPTFWRPRCPHNLPARAAPRRLPQESNYYRQLLQLNTWGDVVDEIYERYLEIEDSSR